MSAIAKNWFDVDREGLAKLLADRSPAFVLFELFSNCADTDAKKIEIDFMTVEGRPCSTLIVRDDDPEGFRDLAHAWTLFAESSRKGDAEKRGRFNLGEKLVLAKCVWAEIVSTTGAVGFDVEGRHVLRKRTEVGSVFEAMVRMTRAEHDEAHLEFLRVIPPRGVEVWFNGKILEHREPVASFSAKLPTVLADAEGFLKRADRETVVDVYDHPGRQSAGWIYEMGVPIVETGDRFDYDVRQKVPLNVDRDNVPPTYLRTLRALALNATASLLAEKDAAEPWVQEAASSPLITPEANDHVLTLQFGEMRAAYDPSDPEANKELMNRGYAIIHGGALSPGRWNNVRRDGLAAPSGRIAPSGTRHGDGPPERVVDPEKYTTGQRGMIEFTQDLAWRLIGKHVGVRIVNEAIALPHAAWYGRGVLTFNLGRLGKSWFEGTIARTHVELIVHELAHDAVSDHLTREFADEVGRLAGKALDLALVDPSFYTYHGYRPMLGYCPKSSI